MPYIDFTRLKEQVSIEEVVQMLDLRLKQKNNQLRGACPACDGPDRSLVITPSKGAFYCFEAKKGGDMIALAAHILEIGVKEAAEQIAERSGNCTSTSTRTVNRTSGTVPESERGEDNPGSRTISPLNYLQAEHDLVQALGISPETCEFFGAGFAPRGTCQGRLAIPVHDLNGDLVGYCARAVKDDQTPLLKFHKDFDPSRYVFNLHRIDGQIATTNDPLDVLMEYECTGETTMVSFLHRPSNVVPLQRRA